VRFDGVPDASGVYMFVADRGLVKQVSDREEFDFVTSGEEKYLTLFVTDKADFLATMPLAFSMGSPFPNPCHPTMKLRYTLPYRWDDKGRLMREPYEVKIAVYDLQGRVVREIAHRKQEPGHYLTVWDGRTNTGRMTSAGAYVVRLTAGDFAAVKRITVIR